MLPLNLGVRGHDIHAEDPLALCQKILALGLSNTQLAVQKSFPALVPELAALTPGAAGYFGRSFAQSGVSISVLGCYVGLSSEDPDQRRRAVDTFKLHLELCRPFGAVLVGTETHGFSGDIRSKEAYQLVLASVCELAEYAERYGAVMAIEPCAPHPIHSPQRLLRLLSDVRSPHVKVILDGANLLTAESFARQEQVMEEAFSLLEEHIVHLHVKDLVLEDGVLRPVPVGTGQVNHRAMAAFAKHVRPLMSVTFEDTQEPDLPAAIRYMRELYAGV